MPHILSIETSTSVLSVALHHQGKTVASITHHLGKYHNRLLTDIIDYILTLNHQTLKNLSAIAIDIGPGSYTGLHIGTSFAKGLCLGTGLPLIGIEALSCILQITNKKYPINGLYCALLDARQGHAYGLVTDSYGQVLQPTKKYKMEIASFQTWLEKQKVYFIGNGADQYKTTLQNHPHSHFIPNAYPQAEDMGKIAYAKFLKKDFLDLTNLNPLYQP